MFIHRQLQLDAHIRAPRQSQPEQIPRPPHAPVLGDELHLLLEDGARTVAGEDEEGAHGALAGMEVFVEAAGCLSALGLG